MPTPTFLECRRFGRLGSGTSEFLALFNKLVVALGRVFAVSLFQLRYCFALYVQRDWPRIAELRDGVHLTGELAPEAAVAAT